MVVNPYYKDARTQLGPSILIDLQVRLLRQIVLHRQGRAKAAYLGT